MTWKEAALAVLIGAAALFSVRGPITETLVARELRSMHSADQRVRAEISTHLQADPGSELPAALEARRIALDADHLERLREIVEEHGWPDAERFGGRASAAAWILAQHADADLDFQVEVLERMQPLVEEGSVRAEHRAFLQDRVLVARGEPQLYGTQYRWEKIDGVVHFGPSTPIREPEQLDRRRSDAGLGPHAEHVEQVRKLVGVPVDAPPLPRGPGSGLPLD